MASRSQKNASESATTSPVTELKESPFTKEERD